MSMWWAGYHGTAFVMNKSEFNSIIEQYEHSNNLDEEVDLFEEDDDFCFNNKSGKEVVITRISTDLCDGMRLIPFLNEEGKPNIYIPSEDGGRPTQIPNVLSLRGGVCYVVFTDRDTSGPGMFQNPYKSYEEIKEEFRSKLGECFPENFDWDAHIGDFSYACCC